MNREDAKAKMKAAAKYVEEKAEAELVAVETKFPLGTALAFLAAGIVIGAYLHSILH